MNKDEEIRVLRFAIDADMMQNRALLKQCHKLEAENARLREALEHIATLGHKYEEKVSAKVAREVLKGGE